MTRLFICLLFLLVLAINCVGQDISRREADSIISRLTLAQPDTDRVDLLLNLAQFHISKPGENKMDLDSATSCIEKAKKTAKNIKSANVEGGLLYTESCLVKEQGPRITVPPYFTSDKSKTMLENAIKILESGTNKDYLGKAYFELSSYYDYQDSIQNEKKTELVKLAAKSFQTAGDFKRRGRCLEMLGDLTYMWDADVDKSIQILKDALADYHSVNYPKVQGVYVLLGQIYHTKHDHALSLSYLLKALKTSQSLQDSPMQLCQINNYLGMLYNDIDRLDMAVKYLNDALRIAKKNNDENALFSVSLNLSSVYNNLGQPEKSLAVLEYAPIKYQINKIPLIKAGFSTAYLWSYLELNRLDSARTYCDIVRSMADKRLVENNDKRARIYMFVAKYYYQSGMYSKARYYVARSNAIVRASNYDYVQMQNLELSYKLDSARSNFKSAYNNLLLFKAKTDSVSGERKSRQFQVMNVEYEVGIKEDSIKQKNKDILLLTQKNNLQQENLNQASVIRNITAVGAILAFIFIGLLYHQYRQKQKSNRVITQKNEQLQHLLTEKDWLVKEIHHRVKNNLQMVTSLLNAQTEFLTHPSAIQAMKESRERMEAIAIIHQKLYQLDNSTLVNMVTYVNDLIDNIKNSFANSEKIEFKVKIDDIYLDISQSLPLGLILNEAITNTIKYAFPINEKGLICISLSYRGPERLQLQVADNGKGLPPDMDIKHSNSLGMRLIHLFSEQLEGDLYFINKNGLKIILNFKAAENMHKPEVK